jgi:hypothetical protein
MSREAFVRRLAGVVVLTGLALGTLVHPAGHLLAAFAGVNLLQSTVTGVCPAGSLYDRLAGGDSIVHDGQD